eukprot:187539-Hanusia_phi.AAC.5
MQGHAEETAGFDNLDEWRGADAGDMRLGGYKFVLTGCQPTCSMEHLRALGTKPFICCGFVSRLFNYGSLESLANDDLVELKTKLQDAVVKDPYDKDSWNNLGRILHLNGESTMCLKCFDNAISIDPTDPSISHNAGVAAESFEKFEQAERYYSQSVRIQKDFIPAKINRALLVLHFFNNIVQSITDLNEVLQTLKPMQIFATKSQLKRYQMISSENNLIKKQLHDIIVDLYQQVISAATDSARRDLEANARKSGLLKHALRVDPSDQVAKNNMMAILTSGMWPKMGIGGEIECILKNFKLDAADESNLSDSSKHEEDAFEEYLQNILNGESLPFQNDALKSAFYYNASAACVIRCIECYKSIGRITSIKTLVSEYDDLSRIEILDNSRRKRDIEQRLEVEKLLFCGTSEPKFDLVVATR